MDSHSWLAHLVAFSLSLVIDILWTLCIRRTVDGSKWSAASISAALILVSGLVTIGFVENKYLLIANSLGGGLGNYLTIALDERHRKRKSKKKHVIKI